jgi:predicted RNA-binding protein YlxR (DUF448 family)
MGKRPDDSERTCVVTRTSGSTAGLIRFVRGPDGIVVPDIAGKLPGRGVWVTGRRETVEEAARRRLFSRGFKADTAVPPDLGQTVDRLLAERALKSLSMARKAGRVVTGFGKVTTALSRGGVVAVLHATEAAEDGRRKVMQAMMRRARLLAEMKAADAADEDADDDHVDGEPVEADDDHATVDEDDEEPETLHGSAVPDPLTLPKVIRGLFRVTDLDLALGGPNVIHAALLAGGASTSFLNNAAALARFRGGRPETDWVAGSPGIGETGHPRHDGSFHTDAVAARDAGGTTDED